MVKILSQSGNSLADMYDVVGSVAGIEELETRELAIIHEMGATLFSERISGTMRRMDSGAIAQSLGWEVILTNLPNTMTRILGLVVFSTDSTRINVATINVRSPGQQREVPIFTWDANEPVVTARFMDNGVAAANHQVLQGNVGVGTMPTMLIGSLQPQSVGEIAFRGSTTAFGAGTVTITAVFYQAFAQIGGVSSRGLPIPSW